jgi:hypothetical protein
MSGHKSSNDSGVFFHGFCSYPNCEHKKIAKNAPFVEWHGVHFSPEQVSDELHPMAKLAVVANPSEWIEKFGFYSFNMELHPECAAEWGMHLIRDAMNANPKVGNKLRST